MGMISEFKEFAMKGNVVDLAVGVVIGAAFGKIVTAVVDNLLMPLVGLMTGGVDFSKWAITLKDAVIDTAGKETTPALTLGVGGAINAIVQFIIVAFFLFMVIKAMNAAKKKEVAAPAAPAEDVALLTEIRDLLKKQ
jgi:large conductance mechanosensitive channel